MSIYLVSDFDQQYFKNVIGKIFLKGKCIYFKPTLTIRIYIFSGMMIFPILFKQNPKLNQKINFPYMFKSSLKCLMLFHST